LWFVSAQDKPAVWDLNTCIEYALENNIQVRKSKVNLEISEVNTKQAQAQLYPNLSASISQNVTNRPWLIDQETARTNSYTGSYGINASMTLFNGGRLVKNIRQQKLQEETSQYAVLEVEKNIEMSILRVYMQILYSQEAVNVYRVTMEASRYQRDRGAALLAAGMISKVDLAQLEAQLSSDKYQLISSENMLSIAKLQLKQLLELNINDEMQIVIPEIGEEFVLSPLPDLFYVYSKALDVMPEMRSSRLNLDIMGLETEKARAGYLPRVSLSASIGTNHLSGSNLSFEDQLRNNFSDGIGLNVSIPVFTNRENKSAVEKARLNEVNAMLDLANAEKDLLQEVESVYLDALTSQNQYMAATEQVRALEESYVLIEQQFNMGMRNTLELLTEKNNLLSAQQSQLQAKYTSIMNSQLLNLYQDLPIDIK
jgi:outer membrane protein